MVVDGWIWVRSGSAASSVTTGGRRRRGGHPNPNRRRARRTCCSSCSTTSGSRNSGVTAPTSRRRTSTGSRRTGCGSRTSTPTALCSPTRACLLTGRNHHRNGMGRVADLAVGFPGYWGRIPKENTFLSEALRAHGYATYAVGKWHLTPDDETHMAAPRSSWPIGAGSTGGTGSTAARRTSSFPRCTTTTTPSRRRVRSPTAIT